MGFCGKVLSVPFVTAFCICVAVLYNGASASPVRQRSHQTHQSVPVPESGGGVGLQPTPRVIRESGDTTRYLRVPRLPQDEGGRGRERRQLRRFVVEWVGFSDEPRGQAAIQAAVAIAESALGAGPPIRARIAWEPLEPGTLGASTPLLLRDSIGVPRTGTYYPAALANVFCHGCLSAQTGPHMYLSLNSAYDRWYFGVDGNVLSDQQDLVTVTLHELVHGLGFSHSYRANGRVGYQSGESTYPSIFDRMVRSHNGDFIANLPGVAVSAALNSGHLWINALGANVRVYSGSPFNDATMVAHLDPTTYPSGPEVMMRPTIPRGSSIHQLGGAIACTLGVLGWPNLGCSIQSPPPPTVAAAPPPPGIPAVVVAAQDQPSVLGENLGFTPILTINCGGPTVADTTGRIWTSDSVYSPGGYTVTPSSHVNINMAAVPESTTYSNLWAAERWTRYPSPNLVYTLPTSQPGRYRVSLLFAEMWHQVVGMRVFSVKVQGTTVFPSLDVLHEAGYQTPLVKAFEVDVTSESSIEVQLVSHASSQEGPAVYAMALSYTANAPPTVPPSPAPVPASGLQFLHRINCGGPTIIDADGHEWLGDSLYNPGGYSVSPGDHNNINMPNIALTTLYAAMWETERWIRWDDNLNYVLAVPGPGTYVVSILLIEMWHDSPGTRVFSIALQGDVEFANVDVMAEVGFQTPLLKEATVVIPEGTVGPVVHLQFRSHANSPEGPAVFGIALARDTSADVPTTPPPSLPPTETSPTAPTAAPVAPTAPPFTAAPTQPDDPVGLIYTHRVNCGGGTVTDTDGFTWMGDSAYNAGGSTINPFNILNIVLPDVPESTTYFNLWQTERWTRHGYDVGYLNYVFNVQEPGTYTVEFYLIEVWHNDVDKRVFDVEVQGDIVFPSLDVRQEAGFRNPLIKYATAVVPPGGSNTVQVRFLGLDGYPEGPAIYGLALAHGPGTAAPTSAPPSVAPTAPTASPTPVPPSEAPTVATTIAPTSTAPTSTAPTSAAPTSAAPSEAPTSSAPSLSPTLATTTSPTESPSTAPTTSPSIAPTTGSPTLASQPPPPPSTAAPTTETPTSASPTTGEPTTASPTTASPMTASPTTGTPTTATPTTQAPTTASPTTAAPTTAEPATAAPTTASPTSAEPTSASPTTASPTTASPTTAQPTTASPTTAAPTNAFEVVISYDELLPRGCCRTPDGQVGDQAVPFPTADYFVCQTICTADPGCTGVEWHAWDSKCELHYSEDDFHHTSVNPSCLCFQLVRTQVPVTAAPVSSTASPTTAAPTSPAPTTEQPTSAAPTTAAPATAAPTSAAPTTEQPTTASPTSTVTTASPSTTPLGTTAPNTAAPVSTAPTTETPTSPAPTTVSPTSPSPTSVAPTTETPTSAAPTTAVPTTASPVPATPAPTSAAPTQVEIVITYDELEPRGCCRTATNGYGNEMTPYELPSYLACQVACTEDAGCTGIEWHDWNSQCELHFGAGDFDHTSPHNQCWCMRKVVTSVPITSSPTIPPTAPTTAEPTTATPTSAAPTSSAPVQSAAPTSQAPTTPSPTFTPGPLQFTWTTGNSLPVSIGEVASAAVGDYIYSFGERSSLSFKYHVPSGEWSTNVPIRPQVGDHHAAVVEGSKIYLVGGFTYPCVVSSCQGQMQAFDTASSTWETLGPLPYHVEGSVNAVYMDGQIHVCGGLFHRTASGGYGGWQGDPGDNPTDCFKYHTSTQVWTRFASIPHGVDHAATTTDGIRMYVVGGRHVGRNVAHYGENYLQVYATTSSTWRLETPLPFGRGGTGAAFIGGLLMVMGGETYEHETGDPNAIPELNVYPQLSLYDRSTGQWTFGPNMPIAVHGFMPVVHGSQVFVSGGGVRAAASASSHLQILSVSGVAPPPSLAPTAPTTQPTHAPTPFPTTPSPTASGAPPAPLCATAPPPATARGIPATVSWQPGPTQPLDIREANGLLTNGRLWVHGGFHSLASDPSAHRWEFQHRKMYSYAPGDNHWNVHRELDLFNGGISHSGQATIDGMIVFAGGMYTTETGAFPNVVSIDDVWAYHIANDSYTAFPPLPQPRAGGPLVELNRRLHFFGGGRIIPNHVFVEDFSDHWYLEIDDVNAGWRTLQSLNHGRNHMAGAAHGGFLYAIGGQLLEDEYTSNQDFVERYDPCTNTWSDVAPLPEGRGHIQPSIFTIPEGIFIAGGTQNVPAYQDPSLLFYNVGNDSWHRLPPKPFGGASQVTGIIDTGTTAGVQIVQQVHAEMWVGSVFW